MTTLAAENFASFVPAMAHPEDILAIGRHNGHGVLEEMAMVFEVPLPAILTPTSLGELADTVTPFGNPDENLHYMAGVLGYQDSALELAADWVRRSQLLRPLRQSFMRPDLSNAPGLADGVIIGNSESALRRSGAVLLGALGRKEVAMTAVVLGASHGPAFQYLENELVPQIARAADTLAAMQLINSDPKAGLEEIAAEACEVFFDMDMEPGGPLIHYVPAETGLQEVGVLRRALQKYAATPRRWSGAQEDEIWRFDQEGDQIYLVTDAPVLAGEGKLHAAGTAAVLHPFTAVSHIIPTMRELLRHMPGTEAPGSN